MEEVVLYLESENAGIGTKPLWILMSLYHWHFLKWETPKSTKNPSCYLYLFLQNILYSSLIIKLDMI